VTRPVTDVAASVRQRLLNLARGRGVAFDQLLVYYAIERFLYRLSLTPWAERLVIKGATLLRVWDVPYARPTRDIDFLGRVPGSPDALISLVRECLAAEAADDGLRFDDEITAGEIRVDDEYPGVRVVMRGDLSGARFRLQLDVGIGDDVVPDPAWVDYPALLPDLPAPRVLAYDPATSIAEKIEAMVKFGDGNSRLKDFYDVWLLATSLGFDGAALAGAIAATFLRRGTELPAVGSLLVTDEFVASRPIVTQWNAFRAKAGVDESLEFATVVQVIRAFVTPVLDAVSLGVPFEVEWPPTGPWTEKEMA
jgi:hypothetical protein